MTLEFRTLNTGQGQYIEIGMKTTWKCINYWQTAIRMCFACVLLLLHASNSSYFIRCMHRFLG